MIEPAVAQQLDKTHRLLKYMLGTKGHTLIGNTEISTCTCGDYSVTDDAEESDHFFMKHRECE